jgi:hypothetical protein
MTNAMLRPALLAGIVGALALSAATPSFAQSKTNVGPYFYEGNDNGSAWAYYPGYVSTSSRPKSAKARRAAKAAANANSGAYYYEPNDNGSNWSYYPGYVDGSGAAYAYQPGAAFASGPGSCWVPWQEGYRSDSRGFGRWGSCAAPGARPAK